ncbi:hypothetical protein KAFR_0A06410 [Kazachstania africana CBS 2517]|uniref:Sulfhydryl oxidase n=1 Tax=Kazachstania africana (strain ATCC 22294 / BCRC 22015 / CBS 2517 / CECT 1963 / NBRC 1671 / NRRL Y-8276) TaxID=1071382 RepID=H2ANX6_KAZAF|nr:hypothetical protein KAFR_0A06410 [Kazachstania africana CBS 2517]CCF56076.1 hypothetical protein KAFR_0A06410 [Kazachstania africana CBS 2517]
MVDPSKIPKTGLTGRTIIYDEDGKPCRSCNTLLDFQLATGKIPKNASKVSTETFTEVIFDLIPGSRTYRKVPPPTKEVIGRSSWTLLHAIGAKYPEAPTQIQQDEMSRFMALFMRVYPMDDSSTFNEIQKAFKETRPNVSSYKGFNSWLCNFHNKVNERLKKEKFDTTFWEDRWANGWE